ncbi:MAG: co-chaperone GroES [Fusobacteriales bacterium]|nr:MAG: co-chaperone GroES [Fusobacteriales bacterium]
MIKPLGNRILVKVLEELNKTKSGIILKDSSTKSDIHEAVVIEISDEIKNINIDDKVYFSKFKGENLRIDENEYIILELKDVLAKEIKGE